jgi:uncharacterized protein YeaO (DUF488 family)
MQQTENYRFKIKRVYELPGQHDGRRIFVDRLWPRGLTKEKASIDLWLKDIAPSTDLRKWLFLPNPSNMLSSAYSRICRVQEYAEWRM